MLSSWWKLVKISQMIAKCINFIIMSLPPKYDNAVEYYERLNEFEDGFKTYDAYQKKLIEIHKHLNLMFTYRKQLESEETNLKSKPKEFTYF